MLQWCTAICKGAFSYTQRCCKNPRCFGSPEMAFDKTPNPNFPTGPKKTHQNDRRLRLAREYARAQSAVRTLFLLFFKFKDVCFTYPTRKELQVLKNFTCTFEAGKTRSKSISMCNQKELKIQAHLLKFPTWKNIKSQTMQI